MISVPGSSFVAGFSCAGRGAGVSSVLGVMAAFAIALGGPAPGSAQTGDSLLVHGPDDSSLSLSVRRSRGYATVSHEALRQLGWAIEVDVPRLRARLGSDGPVVEFSLDSPLFHWDQDLLQLVSAPFSGDGSVQIPLQFLVDFLPARASEAYAFSPGDGELEVLDPSVWLVEGTGGRSIETAGRGITADRGIAIPKRISPTPPEMNRFRRTDPSAPTLQQDLEEVQGSSRNESW